MVNMIIIGNLNINDDRSTDLNTNYIALHFKPLLLFPVRVALISSFYIKPSQTGNEMLE